MRRPTRNCARPREPNVRITAEIRDQPWREALSRVLAAHGLTALGDETDTIRIVPAERADAAQATEPLMVRPYAITGTAVREMVPQVRGILSARGHATISEVTNAVIVTDVAQVHAAIVQLLVQR